MGTDGTLLYVEGPTTGSQGRELLVVDLKGREEVLPLPTHEQFDLAALAWAQFR